MMQKLIFDFSKGRNPAPRLVEMTAEEVDALQVADGLSRDLETARLAERELEQKALATVEAENETLKRVLIEKGIVTEDDLRDPKGGGGQ